jgi:hypothetical protein
MRVRKVPLQQFKYISLTPELDEATILAAEFRKVVLTDRDLHERVRLSSWVTSLLNYLPTRSK